MEFGELHTSSRSASPSSEARSFSPTSPMSVSVPSSPTSSSSIALKRQVIEWYEEEARPSDEELLQIYFRQNEKLANLVAHMKSHKGKRQTDAELIRDYKFALGVFKLLMERKWEVRSV